MTEQELKQGLANLIFNGDCLHHSKEVAKDILIFLGKAGYVRLAEDQSLPELYPEIFAEGLWLPSVQELQRYKKAMEWLIHETDWRKVE